ncbi:MAG: alpha/beta hydrolase [Sphingomonadales bacterium]|nr:alpha/beta hydrolase [Sphingomonadales bacterium]
MPVLNLADAALHYEVAGSGDPPIVLVHGGMCDHRDWDRLVPLLAAHHRAVRLDLRGHGLSGGGPDGCTVGGWAADVRALIGELGLVRPVLVGHSLGTRIVVEAAQAGDAAGVLLLDGSRAYEREVPGSPTTLDAVIAATIGPYADDEARAAVHARMAGTRPEVMAACVAAMKAWDPVRAAAAFAVLGELAVPVLAIQSTFHASGVPRRSLTAADRTTPYLDFVAGAVPQLRTVLLADTGHFVMLERPEIVAGHILAFVSGVSS